MTALPVLPKGAVCVVGADQRVAVNPNSEHLKEASDYSGKNLVRRRR